MSGCSLNGSWSKERIAVRMNDYGCVWKRITLLRAVPLEIEGISDARGESRQPVYHSGLLEYRQGSACRSITGLYPAFWIFYESTNVLQLCSCSYGAKWKLGFTSEATDDRIPRNFQRILKGHEIKSREIREGFPVSMEAGAGGQKA